VTGVAAVLAVALAGCGQAAASPSANAAAPALESTVTITSANSASATAAPSASSTASRCTASQLTVTATTDRPAYRAGDTVTLRTTVTNHSAQPCTLTVSSRDPAFSVSGGGGEVWRTCGPGQSCPLYERLVVVPAGGANTESVPWNQHTCDQSSCAGPQAPSGAYRETATWGDLGSATAPFTVG
jgi:hypothetical protein